MGELIAELSPLLRGSEVRAVQPVPPRDCLLVLTPSDPALGAILRVRLSADPEAARVHLQVGPVKRHEGASDPFFARLEEALLGTVVHVLEQVQEDRVVRLGFRRAGQPVAGLLAELTGRHANLILLDGAGRIVASLIPPARESPAAARLAPGAGYAVPPGRRPSDPGPALAESFPPVEVSGRASALAPLSACVEATLGNTSEDRYLEELRRALRRRLERRAQSARALVEGLRQRERACEAADRLRMDAELLLAHLTEIERGAAEVELPDAFEPDGTLRRIALDPGLSARRNAEKLFARYKKQRRTRERLPEELALAEEARQCAEEWLARAMLTPEDPRELEALAVAAGALTPSQEAPARRHAPEPRLPYIRFRALRGSEVRVGRSARDNDRLTFREANGNDLWLHTADAPGSHVVLRLGKGGEPDEEEVLDAAHLAVHFSPLRGAPRADVHIARRKEVHKPRKAPAGLVTLSGGRVLRLRIQPERLARLLESRGKARGPEGESDERP